MTSPGRRISPVRRLQERYQSGTGTRYQPYTRQSIPVDLMVENQYLKKEIDLLRHEHTTSEMQRKQQDLHYLRELEQKQQQIRNLQQMDQNEIEHLRMSNLILTERTNQLEHKADNKQLNSTEINEVIDQLAFTKKLLSQKQKEIQHLTALSFKQANEYSFNLETLVSENNGLRLLLAQGEAGRARDMNQAENKKQLQKSRTVGILSFCKESTVYAERELNRLTEDLQKKSKVIESLNKELLKEKKHCEDAQRAHTNAIFKLKEESAAELAEREKQYNIQQKAQREEMSDLRKTQADLQEQLASREHELDSIQREVKHMKDELAQRDHEIGDLKDNVRILHDQHSKQLSKVMNESRIKRKSGISASGMYSSGSLKNFEDNQSGQLYKQLSLSNQSEPRLPIVKEEIAVSQGEINDSFDLRQFVMRQEEMLDELKKEKEAELERAAGRCQRLENSLREKQQEIIDLLTKFSPLMEYSINPLALDVERRQKIEQHYKADLDLLDVMLQKNRIVALRPK